MHVYGDMQVKQAAVANVYESAADIAEKIVVEELSDQWCPALPSISNLSRAGNRYRRVDRPTHPTNLSFKLQQSRVPDGFYQADITSGSSRHLMFATDCMLKLLSKAVTWYMDGTFKVVKAPFMQLFSIHAFIRKSGEMKQLPLCFIIMSSRRRCDYEAVLKVLYDKLPRPPAVEKVVTDFEKPLWQAVANVMHVKHRGCAFHWLQTVRRRMRRVPHLSARYSRNQYDRHLLRQVMALPYLPANKIADEFSLLQTQLEDRGFRELTVYIQNTWIASRLWPPRAWSVFNQHIRTNNDCEGWHNRLNQKAKGSGLNLYLLIQLLYMEAKIAAINVRLLSDDKARRLQSKKTKTREARIQKYWDQFARGRRTAGQLLKSCATLHLPTFVDEQ